MIIVAMDSFKSSIRSPEACHIVADAILEYRPGLDIVIMPMADGGEGTARALLEAAGGLWKTHTVTGPLPEMQVEAGFAWFEKDKTALVEMACASGMELLTQDQFNPMKTTTFGTGQLIKAAADCGACKIMLAVGGSATVDGGIGAAAALGWQFLDKDGQQVPLGGQGLGSISQIIAPDELHLPPVEVLCDVDNPLCGPHGAAKVYGPQKGATPQMVEELEKGLANLAEVVRRQLGTEISDLAGAGAAGGLSAGAAAFMNAELVSGIEAVMAQSGLPDKMPLADWVITGEGRFDAQSLRGKVISGIAKLAAESNASLAVIAGQIKVSQSQWQQMGITDAVSCMKDGMAEDYAIENSRDLLRAAAQEFAEKHL